MVRVLVGWSGLFSKLFLVSLVVSVFWMVGVGAEVIVADFTENDLDGHMTWIGFLENCVEGGSPLGSGGSFNDIDIHLVIDTDAETLIGTISGSGDSDPQYSHLYVHDFSFDGTISGVARRDYWAGYLWDWMLEGEVELDLSFSSSYRCATDTPNEYTWISREDSVHVTKWLTAPTASDNNQQFMHFSINRKNTDDPDDPITFFMTEKNDGEDRRAILPLEMPDPIDLSAEISGPSVIGKSSSGETFSLDVSGEQEGLVENVRWYFYFWDDVWGEYRWFQNFQQKSLDHLEINSIVISEWMERTEQFGDPGPDGKSLRMQVYAEFEKGEYEWLAVTKPYNFTVTKGEVVTVSRYSVSGLGQPMKHIQILAESPAGDYLTTTDDKGYFELPSTITDEKEW
jgi:hypothetical protein